MIPSTPFNAFQRCLAVALAGASTTVRGWCLPTNQPFQPFAFPPFPGSIERREWPGWVNGSSDAVRSALKFPGPCRCYVRPLVSQGEPRPPIIFYHGCHFGLAVDLILTTATDLIADTTLDTVADIACPRPRIGHGHGLTVDWTRTVHGRGHKHGLNPDWARPSPVHVADTKTLNDQGVGLATV